MLIPKKLKYRKKMRGSFKGFATSGAKVDFGEFGLKAQGRSYLTSRQIEAARRAMTRYVQKGGQIWIRIFPDIPITKKPSEVKMGKGKGNVDHYAVKVLPGRVLFEISGLPETTARHALMLAAHKLPVKTKIVTA
ncbi:MAG TPA: 50S ribosomal protein L16 [bacterium]|nr:50S ribosomal protein L16 [bacterium]